MSIFMVDVAGLELLPIERKLLTLPQISAVILFTRNFNNLAQLRALIAEIRALRADLFIAVDHEGGVVQRFTRHGFKQLPAACVYGEVYDFNQEAGLYLAQQYGQYMACDLLEVGVDISLAPVLDVHDDQSAVIGRLDRAFHSNPQAVSALAHAFIQGMHLAGMPCVAKHFPGHGRIVYDSHLTRPVHDQPVDNELNIFADLIKHHQLDAIMPAHVTYELIDAHYPAGFSPIWLDDILRRKLQFNGLIISDCLSMSGADIGDLPTRAFKALHAGCDMLIVCNQPRQFMYDFVQNKRFVSEDASLRRLHAFKQKMRRFHQACYHAANVMPPTRLTSAPYADEPQSYKKSKLNTTQSV